MVMEQPLLPPPGPNHLADIHRVDARIEAVVPFLGGVVAEVLLGLVPSRHGFALDDQVGFLVVGRTMLSISYMQAKGCGLVAVATAVAAHILPHLWVVELHDGEARMFLHELPCVASGSHIDGHRRALVAQIVADAAPADGHGVALGGVAAANDEVLREPVEAVFLKLLLHIEGGQGVAFFHRGLVLLLFLAAATYHGNAKDAED